MSIRRIGLASATLFRIRAAVLVVVPALAAGGLLAIGAPSASAAPDCAITTIVANINAVTSQANGANAALTGLSSTSSPQQVQTAASTLTSQLNSMTNQLFSAASSLNGCPALSAADAQTAANAFSNAATATGALLSTIIQKHSIFAQFSLTAPIASALRSLEGAADNYAFTLAGVAPSQANNITSTQGQLDTSLGNAISVYEQLCIPSPLYPAIPPICVSL